MSYKLITLTAGHNAIVPGASGNGYKEHEVARTIVAELEKQMKAVGQEVKVCTDDVGKTQTAVWLNAVNNCNKQPKEDRLDVSVHLNAGGGTGTEVLYYSEKALAAKVSKELAVEMGYADRGPKERKEIGFLKKTTASSILIEVAFIDNKEDMKTLMASGGIKKAVAAIVKSLTGKTAPSNESSSTYTVVKGDTLWSIAEAHGTTVAELKKLNNLTSDALSIGQKLTVKVTAVYHVVKSGDTVSKIATQFNTTLAKIKSLNPDIKDLNLISIGQKIRIA